MTANAKHLSKSALWGTPPEIVEPAKRTLGGVDLDVASTPEDNERIGASAIITAQENALRGQWPIVRSLFCNPPGGSVGGQSLPCLFWGRLMDHWARGALGHAIFVAFSLELLQVAQGKDCPPPTDFPFCIPAKRIAFLGPNGTPEKSPTHANAVIYVPGSLDFTDLFRSEFSSLGAVVVPEVFDASR